MMRTVILVFGAVLLTGVLCNSGSHLAQTMTGSELMGDELYSILTSNSDSNVVFSPLSVHMGLAMLFQGTVGSTHTSLHKTLGVTADVAAEGYEDIIRTLAPVRGLVDIMRNQANPLSVSVANRIFVSTSHQLKSDFEEVIKASFRSTVGKVDFRKSWVAAEQINAWVKKNTNDRINNVVTSKNMKDGSMVLVNAIHFKGSWLHPFSTNLTKYGKFYLTHKELTVYMMQQVGNFRIKDDENLDSVILELPYSATTSESSFSMIIMLPNRRDGLHHLERRIANKLIKGVMAHSSVKKVNVTLPRFAIRETINLLTPLYEMGLGKLYSPTGDMSGMVKNAQQSLRITYAVHKAFIDVTERGTEAGDSTGVEKVKPMRAPRKTPLQFVADHPFMFAVVHRAKSSSQRTVLFYGKVENAGRIPN